MIASGREAGAGVWPLGGRRAQGGWPRGAGARRGAGLWEVGKLPVGAGPAGPPDRLAGVLAASAPQFPGT